MHHTHSSKLPVNLLPSALVPLLLLAAGVLIGRAVPGGQSLDAVVLAAAWFVLCAGLVAIVLRVVAWAVRVFPSADDGDAYYRRRHF